MVGLFVILYFTAIFAGSSVLAAPVARASVGGRSFELGLGVSSVTSGRTIPALKVSGLFGSWKLTGSSTGTRTTVYAQNAWTTALLYEVFSNNAGALEFHSHVGGGGALLSSSYRSTTTSATNYTNDYVIGPAWSLTVSMGPVFLSFDGMLGLRNVVQHIGLNFQDVALVSIGVSL